MKTILTTLLVALSATGFGQEALMRLLSIEPSYANGYFILDKTKMEDETVSSVTVIAMVDKILPSGEMERRTLGEYPIENGHYWRLDPAIKNALTANETVHYELVGLNSTGEDIIHVEQLEPGGWAWPAVCQVSCNSAAYAWTLTGFTNGAQTYIDLHNGHSDGQPFYFYVPLDARDQFVSAYTSPSHFSLPGYWYDIWDRAEHPELYPFSPSWEAIYVPELSGDEPMINGYPVGGLYAGQPGYGIRKDRGPWKELYAYTDNMAQPSQICGDLRAFYNADGNVIAARENHNPDLPQLGCSPLPGPFTGSVSWGSGGPSDCFQSINLGDYGGDLASWADALLDCYSVSTSTGNPGPGIGSGGLLDVINVVLTKWGFESGDVAVRVSPKSKDPKLVSVPKTVIQPGMYEARIHLKDGTILRHFEDVTAEMTIQANFEEFVDIVVYPVPVKETLFAVDFDLQTATTVNMTVVNNVGAPYYSESIEFELPGRNKHVVKMNEQWPNGIYHAHFTFGNGTTRSRSVIVNID